MTVDPRFEAGQYVVLVDHLDPMERTESLTRPVSGIFQHEDLDGECKIVLKKFDAKCYCDAMIKSNEVKGFERYDLFFCKEDKENGHEVCPHFKELVE